MATGRQTITFDDFSAGESGELAEVRPPKGSFTGQNVLRYIDGSIGPRPGLKKFTLTDAPEGPVVGFGFYVGVNVWFIIGTAVYKFDIATGPTQTVTTCTGSLAGTPSRRVRSLAGDSTKSYFTSYGDKSYSLDHPTAVVDDLTGSPGGRIAVVYGSRMLVGATSANPSRLWFSESAAIVPDFDSWPADNFIDVGTNFALYLLAVQRTQLVLAKPNGTWWRLSGTPGVDEVLRQVGQGLRPHENEDFGSTRYSVSADGRVWFVPQHGDYPAVYSGAGFQSYEHLRLNAGFVTDETDEYGDRPSIGVTGLINGPDVLCVSGSKGSAGTDYADAALLFTRGTWTKHNFDVGISGWVEGRDSVDRVVVICDSGAASTTPKFYAWPYGLERPPISGGTWDSLGDNSDTPPDCEFTLPEWWAKSGEEVKVRSVTVDFKKWDHGFDADNNITVTVTPMRLDAGDADAVTETWSEDPSEASASGTRDRQVFKGWSAIPSFGNGFKVKVGGLVGVAIQRVHVGVDVRPEQV